MTQRRRAVVALVRSLLIIGGLMLSMETTPQAGSCGDGVCQVGSATGGVAEGYTSCPQDCAPMCGDGYCDQAGGEYINWCQVDCAPAGYCTNSADCGAYAICSGGQCIEIP
jgi:hypothetical protein